MFLFHFFTSVWFIYLITFFAWFTFPTLIIFKVALFSLPVCTLRNIFRGTIMTVCSKFLFDNCVLILLLDFILLFHSQFNWINQHPALSVFSDFWHVGFVLLHPAFESCKKKTKKPQVVVSKIRNSLFLSITDLYFYSQGAQFRKQAIDDWYFWSWKI